MFGSIGGFEMLVLAIIGLLVFGPRKLPEIGRTLGKAMVEFRRATAELRSSIEREINIEEIRETAQSFKKAVGADLLPEARGVIPRLREEAAALVKEVSAAAAPVASDALGPAAEKKPDSGQGSAEGPGQGSTDATVRS